MLRYLNMFVLIGIALIGISIVGFLTHNHFLIEPGQAENQWASWTYFGAWALMLVNGIISIKQTPPPLSMRTKRRAREFQFAFRNLQKPSERVENRCVNPMWK
jgi:hypothetical protein